MSYKTQAVSGLFYKTGTKSVTGEQTVLPFVS